MPAELLRQSRGRFRLRLLHPVRPMLAHSAAEVGEALCALGDAALEYKLDGARVQVHRDDGEVRVFTRALHDVTDAVPELVEAVQAIPARRPILDGEALVLGPRGGPMPFQITNLHTPSDGAPCTSCRRWQATRRGGGGATPRPTSRQNRTMTAMPT